MWVAELAWLPHFTMTMTISIDMRHRNLRTDMSTAFHRLLVVWAWCLVPCVVVSQDVPDEDRGRSAGIALYQSGKDSYQVLGSYRCRMSIGTQEWRLAYSASKSRIESWQPEKLEDVRVFDGETFAAMRMEEMKMSRGVRGPGGAPLPQSPFDICYDLHDNGLDYYHRSNFMQFQTEFVVSAAESEFQSHPCLVLTSTYDSGTSRQVWCSQEYSGFPLAVERYNADGVLTYRREVQEFKILDHNCPAISRTVSSV